MRKISISIGALALCIATSASAQSAVTTALSQNPLGRNVPAATACYDGRWTPNAKDSARATARAEAAMQKYRELGAVGGNMKKLFAGRDPMWTLDAHPQDVRDLHDPWITRTARLEPIAITSSNEGMSYHAEWRALAADGTAIGTYDGLLEWSGRFVSLNLYSPAAIGKPSANGPFCREPGDMEEWQADHAEREARKAARQAAH